MRDNIFDFMIFLALLYLATMCIYGLAAMVRKIRRYKK
jgi:hypothetical protein